MRIILIGGKARAGKDTTADYIIKKIGNDKVCRIQVGQYIKYYAEKYFGWDGKEETKPRALLQELGTEVIRNKIDPDFHIDRLIQDFKVLSYFYDTFIVSDVRFPVEIEKVKSTFDDVVSIKVLRDTEILTSKQKSHSTETALDNYNNFDYIIDNNGTLEELEGKVNNLLKEIGD